MESILSLEKIKKPIKKAVVTIGIFDGVHLGHKYIIKQAIRLARPINPAPTLHRCGVKGKVVVITFWPHPSKILNPSNSEKLLISLGHRLRQFKELGVDICLLINFTKTFSKLGADEFIKRLVLKGIQIKVLVVGSDFVFGHNAEAGIKTLKGLSRKFNFKLHVIKPITINGHKISSSLIRRSIKAGNIDFAQRLLGRPVSILGRVVHGDKRGRILGYPTANIKPEHEIYPPSGVYVVRIKIAGKIYKGILNIGRRPTFVKTLIQPEPIFEVHIFSFCKNIYSEDIELFFIKKIRSEKRFKDKSYLVDQLKKDELIAKKILP